MITEEVKPEVFHLENVCTRHGGIIIFEIIMKSPSDLHWGEKIWTNISFPKTNQMWVDFLDNFFQKVRN